LKTTKILRLIQLTLFLAASWFIYWAHIYEMTVWNKTFLESVQTSTYNILLYSVSILAIVFLETRIRHINKIKTLHEPTAKTLEELHRENELIKRELQKSKQTAPNRIAIGFLASGVIALLASIVTSSTVLAFIGLGLVFWGALFLYIRTSSFVKPILLDSSVISPLVSLNKIINDLGYGEKSVYLPSTYVSEAKEETIFVLSKRENLKGIHLTPPGLSLTNLFEKELGTNFTKVDLNYLKNNLPKLLTEDLEIANNLKLNVENDMVHIKIEGSIYAGLCKELRNSTPSACRLFGCPLCSSITLAITRSTGKPVIIENIETSEDGKTVKTNLRLLETTELEEKTKTAEAVKTHPRINLTRIMKIILSAFGSAILVWVGWLTWQDMTTWGKDINLILFGSRIGEAIDLGIGMKLIYYLLIGLLLLILGLIPFPRRRRKT